MISEIYLNTLSICAWSTGRSEYRAPEFSLIKTEPVDSNDLYIIE